MHLTCTASQRRENENCDHVLCERLPFQHCQPSFQKRDTAPPAESKVVRASLGIRIRLTTRARLPLTVRPGLEAIPGTPPSSISQHRERPIRPQYQKPRVLLTGCGQYINGTTHELPTFVSLPSRSHSNCAVLQKSQIAQLHRPLKALQPSSA